MVSIVINQTFTKIVLHNKIIIIIATKKGYKRLITTVAVTTIMDLSLYHFLINKDTLHFNFIFQCFIKIF